MNCTCCQSGCDCGCAAVCGEHQGNCKPPTGELLQSALAELAKYQRWERNRAESEASLNAQVPCGHPVAYKAAWEDGSYRCWECEWMKADAELADIRSELAHMRDTDAIQDRQALLENCAALTAELAEAKAKLARWERTALLWKGVAINDAR